MRLIDPEPRFSPIKGALYGLFLALIGGAFATIGWIRNNAPVMTQAAIKSAVFHPAPEKVFGRKAFTTLILGCDDEFLPDGTTTVEHARSDMMMLVRFDFDKQTVRGLSIPRDTYVKLPDYEPAFHKINAFHAYGGSALAEKAVETIFKVKVDRTARLNFEAFVDAVNMFGGVTVRAKKKLEYTDRADGLYIRIKEGPNDLNGYGALGFVRMRHDDDDFARQERQHEFITAIKGKMAGDPTNTLRLADRLIPLLGSAFSADELTSLLRFGIGLKGDAIKLGTVPTNPIGGNVVVDRVGLPDVLARFGFVPELGDPADGSLDWKPGLALKPEASSKPKPVLTPKSKPAATPKPKHANKVKQSGSISHKDPSHKNVSPRKPPVRPRRTGGQQGKALSVHN